jgi:hypothetical protein
MTATKVEAAAAAIEGREPSLGEWVHVAADSLAAGEGEEVLCQASVQDLLWYRLPAKYPKRAWYPVSRAAAALLGELGLERYASIAASDTTTTILEGWTQDATCGFDLFRTAAEASGVKPPDTELLAWGSVMGIEEATAYGQLEVKLEEAIVAGGSFRAHRVGSQGPRHWSRRPCASHHRTMTVEAASR